jgi:hypothetical protein
MSLQIRGVKPVHHFFRIESAVDCEAVLAVNVELALPLLPPANPFIIVCRFASPS